MLIDICDHSIRLLVGVTIVLDSTKNTEEKSAYNGDPHYSQIGGTIVLVVAMKAKKKALNAVVCIGGTIVLVYDMNTEKNYICRMFARTKC